MIYDHIVVGSGIGGALVFNNLDNALLIEKDSNLGGCASTFKKNGKFYNAGATTFIKNNIIDKLINKKLNLKKSTTAIRIIQNNKIIDRTTNFDKFIKDLNTSYPHPNNKIFWSKIKTLDERFWEIKNIYYSKHSIKSYFKTFVFALKLLFVFRLDLFRTADSFIKKTLPNLSQEYLNMIDAQCLITLQEKSDKVPLLGLALGLAYPFKDIYYPVGGMGNIIESILENKNIKRNEKVVLIKKEKTDFLVTTNKDKYRCKNIILNSSIYSSKYLFCNKKIQKYYDKFEFSDKSAFVVNMFIKTKQKFLHHYQIILNNNIPNCISNSFFISFSDLDDPKMSDGGYSLTISTHTKALLWKNLSKDEYKTQKLRTQNFILKEFLTYFGEIHKNDIETIFSATSTTYQNYISRLNCGGKAVSFKNILKIPSLKTPFKGLYNVGDTTIAQGWPGVAIGSNIVLGEL
ncbi:MAG: Phytoene dehydrogenase and related proteins-like [uncultured Campylobacterales bacterium]|uniref:Phytoene dehydrogenase and related proteins-like n=1 Tax=uncultured Campylobacterales bacterium TaxID=352960 RepID=A0A6S6T4X5_9BACT|nr:MAG: Phytoene dehydrogenase and related proteins-like [uncultured Campylobacterales bacterium]